MNKAVANTTVFKSYAVENYVDDYFKKLKKSLPKKIKNGEIEWIYSYGEKLIKRGRRSVLKKVRELVLTKECENPYIEAELLYEKCVSLKRKYWWAV